MRESIKVTALRHRQILNTLSLSKSYYYQFTDANLYDSVKICLCTSTRTMN